MKHGQVQIEAPAAAVPATGENPTMAPKQHENGLDLSRDRVPGRDTVFPDFVNGPNIRFVASLIIACGALYWFPASQGQVQLVQQKVEQHDRDIGEVKTTLTSINGKVDQLLLKSAPSAPAVPASPSQIDRPRPSAHRMRRPASPPARKSFFRSIL